MYVASYMKLKQVTKLVLGVWFCCHGCQELSVIVRMAVLSLLDQTVRKKSLGENYCKYVTPRGTIKLKSFFEVPHEIFVRNDCLHDSCINCMIFIQSGFLSRCPGAMVGMFG